MTHPLILRQRATERTLAMFNGKVVEWGVSDCILIGLTHMKHMGHKRPVLANATWNDEKQALRAMARALKRAGLTGGLPELAEASGLLPISPLEAMIGDLVGIPSDGPWGAAMGVHVGNNQAMAAVVLDDGSSLILVGSAEVATQAWRIDPCQP